MIPVFDCHDEAYYEWRGAGVRGATLVHLDAHHDLEPDGPRDLIHVGNFVRAAIADGLVSELIWVLPQPMWDDPSTRAVALRDLAALRCGIRATVAPLAALAGSSAAVIVDVDLDYLFTVRFDRDPTRATQSEPACSVPALAAAIAARWPSRICASIATSLTGGYTPMRWKHLARELAARLDGASPHPAWTEAARHYAEAERLQAEGALPRARGAFARAVDLDPEYRHPFRTRGYLHLAAGRRADADRAFLEALDLDPADPWARLGLAMLAVDRRRHGDAIRRLADFDGLESSIDAWRTLSRARAADGDRQGAIAARRRALTLALGGAVPLAVWTSNRDRRLVDPDHGRDHASLAALHRAAGDAAAAAAHQRIADAAGASREEPA